MATIKYFVLTAAAALVFTACDRNAPANNATADNTAAKTPPPAPSMDALLTLEKSAYEAWKSKDAKFWDTFLSDKFVGYGSSGKLDKASATREYTGADCEIKGYALSDEQMRPLGTEAALITHKTTVDGTCGGQQVPANSWAAGVYVRDGDKWKGAFHAEAPVVDPKATPAKPIDKKETPEAEEAKPADRGAGTDALLAVEKAVWDAWRAHDAKKIEDLTARDISFINIFGTYFATKADALKDWSGTGCDVKSVSVTDAAGTMLSPTVGILTFKGAADGTCYGQKVGPIWGTSVYVKEGDAWKWTFGINLPARRETLTSCGPRTMVMNQSELSDFARRYAAAWSSGNPASLAACYAEDGSLTVNAGAPSIGRAAITAKVQGFMTAFPDMVVKVDEARVDGSHAIFRWIWTGTNTGPGGTGKSVRIKGYEEWTIGADGLIAESKGHYDEADYQRQLQAGAPPAR